MNLPPEVVNPEPIGDKHRLGAINLLRLSFRVFRTKPLRTFLTILGMSVGIGTVLFLISLGYGLQYILIGKLVATEDSLITIEAFYSSESGLNITQKDLDKILSFPETGEISPIAEFPAELKLGDSSGLILARLIHPTYFRLSGTVPDIGSAIRENEAGAVISSQGLKLMNFSADEGFLNKEFNIEISYQNEKEISVEAVKPTKPLSVKGIISDETQAPFILIPYKFLPKEPVIFKRVLVKAKNVEVVEKLRDKLLSDGYLVSARIDLVNQAKRIMSAITITLGVFGVASLIVSAIGMFNTMIIGFLERIYEVGIMKSLGATDRDVRNLFLAESSMMGLSGGIGGIIFGMGLGKGANFGLNILARHFGGKPLDIFITPMWFILMIIGLSIFIGLVAGFWPARRASHLSPKEAFVKK